MTHPTVKFATRRDLTWGRRQGHHPVEGEGPRLELHPLLPRLHLHLPLGTQAQSRDCRLIGQLHNPKPEFLLPFNQSADLFRPDLFISLNLGSSSPVLLAGPFLFILFYEIFIQQIWWGGNKEIK